MQFTRRQVLESLRANIDRGQPIIGGGAGTGISAKCEEAGAAQQQCTDPGRPEPSIHRDAVVR